MKQNGSKLAEVVINTDLSSMSGEEFNLKKDKYNVSATAYFNGYTWSLENVNYENKKEAKATFTFKNGNKTIISANVSATPEIYITNFEDDWDEDDINSKNNFVDVNILDKIQITGSCDNLKKVIEILDEECNENTDSKVNKYFSINVLFNGSSDPTAKIEFETVEDGWYDYRYQYNPNTGDYEYIRVYEYDYYLMPVIVFNDGSRHSIEDFFNEDDFEDTIDALISVYKDFESMLEDYDFDF